MLNVPYSLSNGRHDHMTLFLHQDGDPSSCVNIFRPSAVGAQKMLDDVSSMLLDSVQTSSLNGYRFDKFTMNIPQRIR